ncbi:MAG: sigma-70 family RNA polymerase sigma factor [Acidimicrobiales bacterium]
MAELDPGEEFRRLFERSRRSLLAQAYLLTGDRQESQDLVQEAFLRAWRDWARVSTLDSPQAWLRRVLYNLSVNRWRNLTARRSHDRLTRLDATSPAPGAGHLDVLKALQSLPVKQRQALVLVAIFDMTTAQAALEMGANEGTVRVWLSRARTTMELLLGIDAVPATSSGERDDRR